MDPTGLQEFLAITEGRTDDEIAHVLAVLTATTQHMDQQKETDMAKKPMDLDEFNERRKAIDPEVQRLSEYGKPIGRWATFDERIEDMERMQRAQDGGR